MEVQSNKQNLARPHAYLDGRWPSVTKELPEYQNSLGAGSRGLGVHSDVNLASLDGPASIVLVGLPWWGFGIRQVILPPRTLFTRSAVQLMPCEPERQMIPPTKLSYFSVVPPQQTGRTGMGGQQNGQPGAGGKGYPAGTKLYGLRHWQADTINTCDLEPPLFPTRDRIRRASPLPQHLSSVAGFVACAAFPESEPSPHSPIGYPWASRDLGTVPDRFRTRHPIA